MVIKKLIAISVVFALVAGAAFAADLSGTVFGKVDLLQGDNKEGSKVTGAGGLGRIDLSASAESEDGTFGGWLRARTTSWNGAPNMWGLAWWKPVEQVKFQIGNNPDGTFDTSRVTRWGYYQIAGDIGVVNAGNAWGGGLGGVVSDYVFFGGYDGFGALLEINPTDALGINIVLPYAGKKEVKDIFKQVIAQITYDIEGTAKIFFTYRSDLGKSVKMVEGVWGPDSTGTFGEDWGYYGDPSSDAGKLFLAAQLNMIENLELDVGLSFTLPVTANVNQTWTTHSTADIIIPDVKYSPPLGVGIGVKYDAGAFGVKSRILAAFAGSVKYTGNSQTTPFIMNVDVMPYYAVSDDLTAFFSFGLGMRGALKDSNEKTAVSFHINPYVQYKFDWSKGLFAGFLLETKGSNNKDEKNAMSWSVPIGVLFSF
jgi:hypothetical protein